MDFLPPGNDLSTTSEGNARKNDKISRDTCSTLSNFARAFPHAYEACLDAMIASRLIQRAESIGELAKEPSTRKQEFDAILDEFKNASFQLPTADGNSPVVGKVHRTLRDIDKTPILLALRSQVRELAKEDQPQAIKDICKATENLMDAANKIEILVAMKPDIERQAEEHKIELFNAVYEQLANIRHANGDGLRKAFCMLAEVVGQVPIADRPNAFRGLYDLYKMKAGRVKVAEHGNILVPCMMSEAERKDVLVALIPLLSALPVPEDPDTPTPGDKVPTFNEVFAEASEMKDEAHCAAILTSLVPLFREPASHHAVQLLRIYDQAKALDAVHLEKLLPAMWDEISELPAEHKLDWCLRMVALNRTKGQALSEKSQAEMLIELMPNLTEMSITTQCQYAEDIFNKATDFGSDAQADVIDALRPYVLAWSEERNPHLERTCAARSRAIL